METCRLLVTPLTVVLALGWPVIAAAQEARADGPQAAYGEEIYGEEITVRAEPLRQIDERALDEERRSLPIVEVAAPDQLGRFPDRDAAGAAQRLAGVTVVRDQGDARLVLVRGFLPSYNSATLDGERIPAGETDERAVALDLVPTELLESVVVTKTLTAAMDGDAVGGTIDLVTRRPPRHMGRRGSASLAAGHDDESDGDRALGTASWGGWLEPKRLGASLSASRLDADRGVDSVETRRDGGEPVEIRQQDHTVERSRSGVAASVEWLPVETTSVLVRGLWSEFVDLERRRARVLRREESDEAAEEAEASVLSELKDRREWQTVESLSLSAAHQAGDWLLQPRASWSRGEEADPNRLDTIFVLDGEDGDEREYVLEGFRTESDRSSNEDLVASFDLSRSFGRDGRRGTWQAGLKIRGKDLRRDDNLLRFEVDDDAKMILLSAVADPAWRPADPFFGTEFDLGPFADPHAARELFARLGLEAERDPEEDLGDFEAEESVTAAYAMSEWALGDSVSLLAGVRWEDTETSYLAREIVLSEPPDEEVEDDEEAEEGEDGAEDPSVILTPVRGGGSYDEFLPSLIVRGALGKRDVLRAAVGRSLTRPGLEFLAPSRLVVPEDREIFAGNPALRPTTSWNLDLQWQRSLDPLGSLSVSLYAKELNDVIALVATEEASVDEPFTVLQPRNAGDATVRGVELSYRNRFRSLPAPFDGLGLHANLTWATSDAELQGRTALSIPGQADVSGSVVLSYERSRLSVRLLYSYRDDILEELGDTADEDVYLESRSQLDLSLHLQTGHQWSVFAEAFNLTREDVHRYEGTSARPVFEERVGWWATVGVRFDL